MLQGKERSRESEDSALWSTTVHTEHVGNGLWSHVLLCFGWTISEYRLFTPTEYRLENAIGHV